MTITFSLWWLVPLSIVIGADMVLRLWVFFLAIMKLQDVRDDNVLKTLDPTIQKAAKLVLFLGALLNLLVRWTVACAIFGVFPKTSETGVSMLVARLRAGPEGWRKERAQWWTRNVLGPFDRSGRHSEKENDGTQ